MIRVRDLTRRFVTKGTTVEAVRGLSFDVLAGELVAFLGPNGAGKSTAVRILTTLLPPTSGGATIAGHDVVREPGAVRRAIGYVGQATASGGYHRVRDELVTQGRAQRMTPAAARARADELLDQLELAGTGDRLASTLSGGQKRRLDVALGLVHAPRVLFLDEPTTGLDPHSRANLWQHIRALREAHGTTVFFTTHYLDEADAFADRVMVIDHGVMIANDTPANLKSQHAGDRIEIAVANPDDAARAALAAQQLPGARESRAPAPDGTLAVTVERGDAKLPGLLRDLERSGIAVATARVDRPTLDDVFLNLTGRSLRDVSEAA